MTSPDHCRESREGQSWGWEPRFPGMCVSPWNVNVAILINPYFFLSPEAHVPMLTLTRARDGRWTDVLAFALLVGIKLGCKCRGVTLSPLQYLHHMHHSNLLPLSCWSHGATECEWKLKTTAPKGRSGDCWCHLGQVLFYSAPKQQSWAECPPRAEASSARIGSAHLG